MSDIADKLFEGLRTVVDGVQAPLQEFIQEVMSEGERLGTQGAMELASALYNHNGFVPYGPGQYTPTPEQAQEPPQEQHQEQQPDLGLGR